MGRTWKTGGNVHDRIGRNGLNEMELTLKWIRKPQH